MTLYERIHGTAPSGTFGCPSCHRALWRASDGRTIHWATNREACGPVQSPFTRRALAGELPAKEVR